MKSRFRGLILYSVVLATLLLTGCNKMNPIKADYEQVAINLEKAYRTEVYLPFATDVLPALTLNNSYKLQQAFVRLRLGSEQVAGYKAALTSKQDQKRFSVDEPISGVLFQSGNIKSGAVIPRGDFHIMQVETELGFSVSEAITSPITDEKMLMQKISSVFPVIELPNMRFESMQDLTLINALAVNVFSAKFILGRAIDFEAGYSENIEIKLRLNDEIINQDAINDSMHYQRELLIWLINKRLELGEQINPGEILITGAIGKVNLGQVGTYEADYGKWGKIGFTVTEAD